MVDILDDENLELEGLFASDNSSMRNRHIEFARRDYVKLKQLGYVRAPSELKLNEYLWVDVLSYLQPRTQVEEIEENLEIRILQHPNGLWTYGVFVSYGTRGWSFLPGLFTGLFRSENEAHDTAITCEEDKGSAFWYPAVGLVCWFCLLAGSGGEALSRVSSPRFGCFLRAQPSVITAGYAG